MQQNELLAMSDANGAAMADLLSALDSAMLNGEPESHKENLVEIAPYTLELLT